MSLRELGGVPWVAQLLGALLDALVESDAPPERWNRGGRRFRSLAACEDLRAKLVGLPQRELVVCWRTERQRGVTS